MGALEGMLGSDRGDSPLVKRVTALLTHQRERAGTARARFFEIWSQLDRKKLRKWMKPRGEAGPRHKVSTSVAHKNGYHL
jgi:hypothetical protein